MPNKTKITRNAIKCKVCGEVIESKHCHDWQCCKCFRDSGGAKGCFVDGGDSYLRRGGNPDEYEELSETRPYTAKEIEEENKRREESYRLLYGNDWKDWI